MDKQAIARKAAECYLARPQFIEQLRDNGRQDLVRPLIYPLWQYRLIHNAPGEEW